MQWRLLPRWRLIRIRARIPTGPAERWLAAMLLWRLLTTMRRLRTPGRRHRTGRRRRQSHRSTPTAFTSFIPTTLPCFTAKPPVTSLPFADAMLLHGESMTQSADQGRHPMWRVLIIHALRRPALGRLLFLALVLALGTVARRSRQHGTLSTVGSDSVLGVITRLLRTLRRVLHGALHPCITGCPASCIGT